MSTDDCTTRFVFDRETHDFACYATIAGNEQLIGFAAEAHEAAALCRDYRFDFYADRHSPEQAAAVLSETIAAAATPAESQDDNLVATIAAAMLHDMDAALAIWFDAPTADVVELLSESRARAVAVGLL